MLIKRFTPIFKFWNPSSETAYTDTAHKARYVGKRAQKFMGIDQIPQIISMKEWLANYVKEPRVFLQAIQ